MAKPSFGCMSKDGILRAAGRGSDSEPIIYERYVWTPSEQLRALLPPDLTEVALARVQAPNGGHRFLHEEILLGSEEAASMIPRLASLGLAMLELEGQLSQDELRQRRFMLLVFSFRRYLREHRSTKFTGFKSLQVRGARSRRESLASFLDPNMSSGQLLNRGRTVAGKIGLDGSKQSTAIALAIYAIAKLNPVTIHQDKLEGYIRAALFDVDPAEDLPTDVLDHPLVERLWNEVVSCHSLDEDSFRRRFQAKLRSLKRLAGKKRAPGGAIDPVEARRAMLGLIWQSYRCVGDCVDRAMRAIRDAIRPRLSGTNRLAFDRLHLKVRALAELPWLLLSERRDLMTPVLWEWWVDPAAEIEKILHTVLINYAHLADEARRGDRQRLPRAKRRTQDHGPSLKRPSRKPPGGSARSFAAMGEQEPIDTSRPDLEVANSERFNAAWAQITSQGPSCGCRTPSLQLEDVTTVTDGSLMITYKCASCKRSLNRLMTCSELEAISTLPRIMS